MDDGVNAGVNLPVLYLGIGVIVFLLAYFITIILSELLWSVYWYTGIL